MTSDEIRETFLTFFEARDHRRLPSAPLVPAQFDPSVLLTTAGMHPLKPYFLGRERAPHHLLTSCQKCFRTTDIENVGNTARHLTFFEMLGNFSIGDYFKQGAVEHALELSLDGFGFAKDDIWVTVFAGDDELGLGPDEEAISAWESVGIPRERIVLLGREDNFWQSGPTGPCGPCSELYLDRGDHLDGEAPGDDGERFLEYWNLVFMQYDQDPVGTLTPLPAQNIDTGLGLNRMALIQQGAPTIFETDQFRPLVALGRELATRDPDERALRILADHGRGMTFLIADGVVPSNEDRGYILRRLMRRALLQAHRLGMEEGGVLPRYVDVVLETMGDAYPELREQRGAILKWVSAEEDSFGRTLEQGTKLLDDLLAAGAIGGEDAFRLHDTFGFPIELTREVAAERGAPLAPEIEAEFTEWMERARSRSRAAAGTRGGPSADLVAAVAGEATTFTGYEHLEERTTVSGLAQADGKLVVKLAESPFYAAGGGQIADSGVLEWDGGRAEVLDVVRAGEDQAIVVEAGGLAPGTPVVARVDATARHATQCNHTATHLLHAALRARLGDHVHQAGSYVGPDKLRFDFSHTARLTEDERRDIEEEVNRRILANEPVRPQVMPLEQARALGAMALFGEKYGDVVRMVEIGDGSFSRELCGGTHVRSTAEIGVFKVLSEGSSAANVRRIEAITGPAAVEHLRERDRTLEEAAAALRTQPEAVPEAVARLQADVKAAAKARATPAVDPAALAESAEQVDGARVLVTAVEGVPAKALVELADKALGKLGAGAVVLGSVADEKVGFAARVAPELVARGVKAGDVVRAAAQVAGGGGGGRDTMAQAGGKDPAKLGEALAAARSAIERALG